MDTFWAIFYTTALVLLLRYIYRYLMRPFTYWEERGIKSVPAIPIIGSLYENFTQELHTVLLKRYREYGRIHGFYEGSRPVLLVGEPELLKDIFVKDFHIFPSRRDLTSGSPLLDKMVSATKGEEWKRVRTIITPTFSSGKIKKLSSIVADAAVITAKNFEKCADSNKPADCKKLFGAFTMDVIARAAFGTKLDSHNDTENEFVSHARAAFQKGVNLRLILFFLMPKLLKLFRIGIFRSKATFFFRDATLSIVKQRRETGQKQNDFLQLLMDAADEELNEGVTSPGEETYEDESEKAVNDLGHDDQNKQLFKPTKKYKGLSHDELVAQCVLFFLAGYDTTASTLSFASYLLALNPDCQETLIKEIDETLEKSQGKFTYESLQGMKYLDNVIWETLRIFPPAIGTDRQAAEDYKLGSTGIEIKRGMIVSVPIYAMHHDSEFYEEPEKFNPDRFNPEEKSRRNPYTFLPFGAGPRNCVGMRFALIEIKFCLATLLSKFRLKKGPETKVPLDFHFGLGLLQPKAILLKIERRNDCVV